MKKLTASLFALLLAMTVVLGGCGGETAAPTDDPEVGVSDDNPGGGRRERD